MVFPPGGLLPQRLRASVRRQISWTWWTAANKSVAVSPPIRLAGRSAHRQPPLPATDDNHLFGCVDHSQAGSCHDGCSRTPARNATREEPRPSGRVGQSASWLSTQNRERICRGAASIWPGSGIGPRERHRRFPCASVHRWQSPGLYLASECIAPKAGSDRLRGLGDYNRRAPAIARKSSPKAWKSLASASGEIHRT
jgi:hypothetical protein